MVDDTFILGVGDIGDVKDLMHGVRQALQTAAGLPGFGNQGRKWEPLQTDSAAVRDTVNGMAF